MYCHNVRMRRACHSVHVPVSKTDVECQKSWLFKKLHGSIFDKNSMIARFSTDARFGMDFAINKCTSQICKGRVESVDTKVGFSTEFTALKLRYVALKEQVANQIEIHDHLVRVVGPNIRSRYMMLVGQYEYRVFELEIEIARWKRRFTLRQAAINMGLKADYLAIEAQLDREFAEYIGRINRNIEEIKKSSLIFHGAKLSDKENTELRIAYLTAVKLLHPDLNPGLPDAAINLWHEIVKAYDAKDWAHVRYLASLAKEVAEGEKAFNTSHDGMSALREACGRLQERSKEVQARTDELKKHLPFTYDVLLDDEEALEKRREELKDQIREREESVRDYEQEWKNV